MTKKTLVSVDFGNGAFKVASKHGNGIRTTVYQSHVGKVLPGALRDGGSDSAQADLVEFGDRSYWVGERAHHTGDPVTNMSEDRMLGNIEAQALLYAALATHFGKSVSGIHLGAALSLNLMSAENKNGSVQKMNEWLVGTHTFWFNGDQFEFGIDEVGVFSQPQGAIYDFGLDNAGHEIEEKMDVLSGQVAFVSIGMSDLIAYAVENLSQTPGLTRTAKLGVRNLADAMDSRGVYPLGKLDKFIRTGEMPKPMAEKYHAHVDEWVYQIAGFLDSVWKTQVDAFDAFVFVGGGPLILNGHLSRAFGDKYMSPQDPVTSIARGVLKYMVATEAE